jgi:hypothetical protein
MYQLGERKDLDMCGVHLPEGVQVSDFLGDSMLVSDFAEGPYGAHMQTLGICIEGKPLPTNLDDYAVEFASIAKRPFNRNLVSVRQLRLDEAFAYAYRYLHDEEFRSGLSHIPHLEFALAIESQLSVYVTNGRKEYYDAVAGRWEVGADHRSAGKDLSELFIAKFSPKTFAWEVVDGKRKRVPKFADWDTSRFRNAPYLAPIGNMVTQLKPRHFVELDCSDAAVQIRNFSDGVCLDFNIIPPSVDWDNDLALANALELPRRASRKEDRISRFTGIPLPDYTSPGRFDLARIIQNSCMYPPPPFQTA